MRHLRSYYTAGGVIGLGILLLALALLGPVRIVAGGHTSVVHSPALTAGGLLRAAGIALAPQDRVRPSGIDSPFFAGEIRVERAVPVQVWANGRVETLVSAERIPANLLEWANVRLFPGDVVLHDGQPIDPAKPVSASGSLVLQVRAALPVTLDDAGQTRVLISTAATLGEALWDAGIRLSPQDRLDPPAGTPLTGPLQASIRRAAALTVAQRDQSIRLHSAAPTVGEALTEAGLSLQGMDYTVPSERSPIPADGRIHLVRVQEKTLLEQTKIPFKSETQADPNTELDQRSLIQAGQPGIQVSRVRVRYEDGQEVARRQDAQWTASAPQNEIVGYGTKIVLHTETVDGVTIEYWRKITAYATAYTACDAGSCGGRTASGAPVAKGVVAVIRSWYNQLVGTQVYVPGYGQATIADIGGGIPGANWIDLGYSEGDYVSWHSNVTVYFLAPAPASIPWGLP